MDDEEDDDEDAADDVDDEEDEDEDAADDVDDEEDEDEDVDGFVLRFLAGLAGDKRAREQSDKVSSITERYRSSSFMTRLPPSLGTSYVTQCFFPDVFSPKIAG